MLSPSFSLCFVPFRIAGSASGTDPSQSLRCGQALQRVSASLPSTYSPAFCSCPAPSRSCQRSDGSPSASCEGLRWQDCPAAACCPYDSPHGHCSSDIDKISRVPSPVFLPPRGHTPLLREQDGLRRRNSGRSSESLPKASLLTPLSQQPAARLFEFSSVLPAAWHFADSRHPAWQASAFRPARSPA